MGEPRSPHPSYISESPGGGHTAAALLLLLIGGILIGGVFVALNRPAEDSSLVRQLAPRPRATSVLAALQPGRASGGTSAPILVQSPTTTPTPPDAPTPVSGAIPDDRATPVGASTSVAASTPSPAATGTARITTPTATGTPSTTRGAPTPGAVAAPGVATPPTRPASPTPTLPPGTRTHVIAPGDTLFELGLRYGTTVDALMAANGITDRREPLTVGRRLIVPPPP